MLLLQQKHVRNALTKIALIVQQTQACVTNAIYFTH
jgi:hypothetical protein